MASTLEWDIPKIEAHIENTLQRLVAMGRIDEERADEWRARKAFPMEYLSDGTLVPRVATAPNFNDPTTAPFQRLQAQAYVQDPRLTEKYKDGFGAFKYPVDTFLIGPDFWLFWDEDLGEYTVKIVVGNVINSYEGWNGNDFGLSVYSEKMHISAIYTAVMAKIAPENEYNDFFRDTFSLTLESYKRFGEEAMKAAYAALAQGDPSLLSQPGMVVDLDISDFKWYR